MSLGIPTKSTGDNFTAAECNSIVNAIDNNIKFIQSSWNQTSASGTQVFTSVGFQPKVIYVFACDNDVTGEISWGVADATTEGNVFSLHNAVANAWNSSPDKLLYFYESLGNYTHCELQSMDSDGFTLYWTKIGSPTGTVLTKIIAFG